jgi:uncharacterized membrane protein (UPF0127 family)
MSKSKLTWFTSGKQKRIMVIVVGIGIILVGMTAYDRSINQRVQDVVGRCTTHHANYEVISYMLRTKSYNLLVADTGEKQEYGLMNIASKDDICGYDGMIFLYRSPQIYTFWNKNTLVDLELTWRNEKTKYESTIALPNISHGMSTVSSQAPVDTVIEILKK